ncbi:MAG TPA: glycosyltransferase family 2 protein [Thermomicrobiales bacterium]|nr:glycosyltransferase family 2 protein [Thermomicrobiales bacterium]
MPRLAINIVTHDSAARIDGCLVAVFAQTWHDFAVTVVDNASRDGTLDRLAPWRERGVRVVANPANRYYARAHNQAIRETDGDLVLTLNPDVLLYPDYLAAVVAAFESSPAIGSVNGKLLLPPGGLTPALLDRPPAPETPIDGAGLTLRRSRRPDLRGNRRPHGRCCLAPRSIFGVDGACGAYRRAMLDDVALPGADRPEYFDEDFVIYREDVDLAWRAQLYGWDSVYTPAALAYHARTFHVGRGRRAIPAHLKRHAVKNGWLLLVKNADAAGLLRDLPFVLPYQLKILAGLAAVERSSLGALPDTLRLLPRALRKRAWIQAHRRRAPSDVRRRFA